MVVLIAILISVSAYLISLYVQEVLHEQYVFKRRLEKVTMGSFELLQRVAAKHGGSVLMTRNRAKKSFAASKQFIQLILTGMVALFLAYKYLPEYMLIVGVPVGGMVLFRFVVLALKTKRDERIRRELPGVLDLIIICLGAGLGMGAAFERVANETGGSPLGEEFRQIVNESNSGGIPLEETLRNFEARLSLPEISRIVGPIIQAHKTGASILEMFQIQSESLREKMKLSQKEKLMRIPVLVMLPMAFFIMPVIFLIIGGPIAISMMKGGF